MVSRKTILELGCGYGDIGNAFTSLGAIVTYVEGRTEHCEVLKYRFPDNRIYNANLEKEWPFEGERFDMILHLGLLYHLRRYKFTLKKCFQATDNLVLETEVCDSAEPECVIYVPENKQGYDQAIDGYGVRPSAEHIEAIFKKYGFEYFRVKDSRCNSGIHTYDWPVKHTRSSKKGQRRFWFCKRDLI